jgi:hypothetical protein
MLLPTGDTQLGISFHERQALVIQAGYDVVTWNQEAGLLSMIYASSGVCINQRGK